MHLAPGDPFASETHNIPPEVVARLRAQFGYDRPLLEQYARYIGNVARGNLGYSHLLDLPVSRALAAVLPRTLLLMGLALVISFALAMWLGVYEVRHWRSRRARVTNGITLLEIGRAHV